MDFSVQQCLLSAFVLLFFVQFAHASPAERHFSFSYEVLETAFPAGKAVDIYIPLPAQYDEQVILKQNIDSSLPGNIGQEERYGNSYFHVSRAADSDAPLTAALKWEVRRTELVATESVTLSPQEHAQYLAPNALVPVSHEILDPIRKEIHAMRTDDSKAATARAIYDWVVDNVEYKKVGTGWGNGDTFWACNERYGNCTDFHALFISLARSEGIPARFEIGFPLPSDKTSGEIGGYHCWVRFFLPEQGWVPIDASEAAKHPEMRETLYGSHPPDRIHFTTGRDLVINPRNVELPTESALGSNAIEGQEGGENTLNYFVYPYVEVDGKPWKGKLKTRFFYSEL